MATAWTLYLSVGIILTSSNCAHSFIRGPTTSNDLIVGRNVTKNGKSTVVDQRSNVRLQQQPQSSTEDASATDRIDYYASLSIASSNFTPSNTPSFGSGPSTKIDDDVDKLNAVRPAFVTKETNLSTRIVDDVTIRSAGLLSAASPVFVPSTTENDANASDTSSSVISAAVSIDVTRVYDERNWTSTEPSIGSNVSTISVTRSPSSTLAGESVATAEDTLSPDYVADVFDVFTEDYQTIGTNLSVWKSTTDDISSLRKKFFNVFTNLTTNVDESTAATTALYAMTTTTAPPTSVDRNTRATMPPKIDANGRVSKTSGARRKEQLQFPGITLKVSHVLIPKQKRSRYNIQNMRIELPKTEILSKSPASVRKTSKNSNCTRFPVQVVTSAAANGGGGDVDAASAVNLTEERYDCEFSSEIKNAAAQRNADPIDSIRTYYGGYVFRYTIPKANSSDGAVTSKNESTSTTTSSSKTAAAETSTVDAAEDYDSSYVEYGDSANNSGSTSGAMDDAIFPNPTIRNDNNDGKETEVKTESYDVVPLADIGAQIDSDLHDHDVMDSVMYVYFGGNMPREHRGAGRQIIIVGAVIALVAQFLTLASSIRRIKTHQKETPTIILLNVEIALTLTNLIFILGVQSTSYHIWCKMTAISLYYLHVATLLWFLLSSVYSVQIVRQSKTPTKFYIFCICGWIVPLVFTSLSYLLNERSFETSSYCWISPLRGILVSYILPVILLCVICIVLTVYGLRRTSDMVENADDTYSHRKLLRISAVALPLFSVIWFTGMVALENSSSLLFSMLFLISSTVLNWLLFGCWLPSEASRWKDMDEDYYDEDEDFDDEPLSIKRRFDDQPLLSELYEYGAQGQLHNLRIEPISIISAP